MKLLQQAGHNYLSLSTLSLETFLVWCSLLNGHRKPWVLLIVVLSKVGKSDAFTGF